MNKKILFPVCLIILIGLAVFVSALSYQDQIEVSADVEKGWNLISNGIFAINPSQDSEIQIEDISAIYYYDSNNKEYDLVFPFGSLTPPEEEEIEDIIMKEVAPAAWIYSEKKGNLKFITDDVLPLNQLKLYSGWNFVSITPEFMGKSLNNLKGNCNIESAYVWDSGNQEWYLNQPAPLDEEFYQGAAVASQGEGVLIKVSSNCNLGTSGSSTSPPVLPDVPDNDLPDEDTGEYIIEQDINVSETTENIIFVKSEIQNDDDLCFISNTNDCPFYRGTYSYYGELEVFVIPEQMSNDQFSNYIEKTYSGAQEADFVGNDYYIYIEGDDAMVMWYSSGKMIFVQREPYVSGQPNDYMEDFLTIYLNKYPSDLNLI